MDIGVCMRPEVLAHKLEARREPNPEQAWNLSRWPNRLSEPGVHRLFVAVAGTWRGYFVLAADALYSPNAVYGAYTLLFDTRTWTPISQTAAKRFRGFTYDLPLVVSALPTHL